ncbi:hypothetical protein AGRHK599_LOCUS3838 [Rhizobium rhizogenes]|uniref:Uncharacterized protein n=1 Tax=Rhizobium rhizogenes TaxID=359 RepID=A0AAN2A6M0_RHIRH|nr:hypothetical protein N434_02593 [Rhizobium sp. UGM030330-04]CAD0215590.1 hypothetical protein AGRHK599_LOCUS3838 [Rhizobium rhizogenes]
MLNLQIKSIFHFPAFGMQTHRTAAKGGSG